MPMREEVKQAIKAASPGMSQQLYSTLVVMGELLSEALDRIEVLEKKGAEAEERGRDDHPHT